MRLTVRFWEGLSLALALASLPCIAARAADETANVAVRYHCAGRAELTANTNLVVLNKILSLPSTLPFRNLVLHRVSEMLASGLNIGTNAATTALLQPLLTDVLKTESAGNLGGSAAGPLDFVVALRLDAKESQLWQNNFTKALAGAGEKFTTEGFTGRRWNGNGSNSLWIVPAGDWLLAGRGSELMPVQLEYLQQVKRQGRPVPPLRENWLDADMDWARLAAWAPDGSRLLKGARVKMNMAARKGTLHLSASVIYPEGTAWKSDAWQVPTELIRSPLTSFTAGQDVGALFKAAPIVSQLAGSLLTNQFYAWVKGEMPFQTYVAWPVADASNVLEKLSTEAPSALNAGLKQFNGSQLVWQTDDKRLYMANLGMVAPDLAVAEDHGRSYLLTTMFPLSPKDPPMRDELLKQVEGHTNLVYYDWELTGPRLQELRLLAHMLLNRPGAKTHEALAAKAIEERWLAGLRPMVGNTVTEITNVSPNEVSLVRNSPIGFTAIEILLLSDWLSEADAAPVSTPAPTLLNH